MLLSSIDKAIKTMKNWNSIPSDQTIKKTARALEENNFRVYIVNTKEEAREKALALLPKGAEVLQATSVTLDTLGITERINTSGDFDAVKPKLMQMNRQTNGREMQKLGAAPEYVMGSVHAVTEDGKVIIASNSGSQLPAYTYGSANVIWVVGAQKIVKTLDDGIERIYDHVLPQESVRANKAYNITSGSFVSKLLIYNREPQPNRISIILVKESLGF